jgi:hypothetical protein
MRKFRGHFDVKSVEYFNSKADDVTSAHQGSYEVNSPIKHNHRHQGHPNEPKKKTGFLRRRLRSKSLGPPGTNKDNKESCNNWQNQWQENLATICDQKDQNKMNTQFDSAAGVPITQVTPPNSTYGGSNTSEIGVKFNLPHEPVGLKPPMSRNFTNPAMNIEPEINVRYQTQNSLIGEDTSRVARSNQIRRGSSISTVGLGLPVPTRRTSMVVGKVPQLYLRALSTVSSGGIGTTDPSSTGAPPMFNSASRRGSSASYAQGSLAGTDKGQKTEDQADIESWSTWRKMRAAVLTWLTTHGGYYNVASTYFLLTYSGHGFKHWFLPMGFIRKGFWVGLVLFFLYMMVSQSVQTFQNYMAFPKSVSVQVQSTLTV